MEPETDKTRDDLPLLLTINRAIEWSGLPRTRLFNAMKTGELKSVKLGKRRLIPSEALKTYVDQLIAQAE